MSCKITSFIQVLLLSAPLVLLTPNVLCSLIGRGSSVVPFFWPNITSVFSFGDSYTDTVSRYANGTLSSDDNSDTTSGGRMWIEYLTDTYNVTSISRYNFAYGGAVTDESIVAQDGSAIRSFKDQTTEFVESYAPPGNNNNGATWTSETSLFTVFIGINDIGKSYYWTNETQKTTNARVQQSYFLQLARLREVGARNFLLLEVPDVGRTPDLIAQGAPNQTLQTNGVDDFNMQLAENVEAFQQNSSGLGTPVNIAIHPTREVFDFFLNDAAMLGFENVTDGWWTGLGPKQHLYSAATYFWWNNFHPTWGVHDLLAHSVSTFVSKWSGL